MSEPSGIPVLLVIGQLELGGGAEGQIAELTIGLRDEGFRPTVVSLRAGPLDGPSSHENYYARNLRERGMRVIELPRWRSYDAVRLIRLARILRQEAPSLVHSQMFAANAYTRAASLLSGRRPILVTSELTGIRPTRLERLVDRCLEPFTDLIIANADAIRRALLERGTRVPIRVVPNGIDTDRYDPSHRAAGRARLRLREDTPLVGIVARMSAEKNYPLFIEVVRRASAVVPSLRAVAIGDGPLRAAIEAEAHRAGVGGIVSFVGKVDRVQDLLPALDVFVLTSTYEGLSNAVMEAQASGVPAVVTVVGGNAEIVLDGVTGFVVSPADAEGFARRVADLLSNPGLRARMGRAGRTRMEEQFSMRAMVRCTAAVYRDLLGRRS